MCDNGYKNDALRELEVPALLDLLEVPYTGAGPTCLGMCYDKSLVRAVAVAHGVPVPRETYFDMSQQTGEIPSMFPALIKPNRADGSVGITAGSVVHDAEAAHRLSQPSAQDAAGTRRADPGVPDRHRNTRWG